MAGPVHRTRISAWSPSEAVDKDAAGRMRTNRNDQPFCPGGNSRDSLYNHGERYDCTESLCRVRYHYTGRERVLFLIEKGQVHDDC